jgi:SagB-type dehydrogenase family enzyme
MPVKESKVSVEEALDTRKSIRAYLPKALTLEEVSNIAWAAYGKNKHRKTVPSAGALYPMFIYFAVGDVINLEEGVYLYDYANHALRKVSGKDVRFDLAKAALSQSYVKEAPLVAVICARYEITTSKYGKRGIRYVHIEVGHVAQNIYLEAASLGLGTVDVGAFMMNR